MQDAMDTIQNAVTKMNRLTRSLKKEAPIIEITRERVDIGALIKEVMASRKVILPSPKLTDFESRLFISAEKDRLAAVIEHLVQNAQEATSQEGKDLLPQLLSYIPRFDMVIGARTGKFYWHSIVKTVARYSSRILPSRLVAVLCSESAIPFCPIKI